MAPIASATTEGLNLDNRYGISVLDTRDLLVDVAFVANTAIELHSDPNLQMEEFLRLINERSVMGPVILTIRTSHGNNEPRCRDAFEKPATLAVVLGPDDHPIDQNDDDDEEETEEEG